MIAITKEQFDALANSPDNVTEFVGFSDPPRTLVCAKNAEGSRGERVALCKHYNGRAIYDYQPTEYLSDTPIIDV
jgi:hypothetical protein